MNTLTLLVGLPASGKSTYAREHLSNDTKENTENE